MEVIIGNQVKEAVWKDKQGGYGGHHEVDGIDFDGHRVLWRFEYLPETYLKESELSGDQWRKGGQVKIYRNNICVFNDFCRRPEQAIFTISGVLGKLQDFYWEAVEIGRRVYYMETPAIIKRVLDDGEVIVEIEDKTKDFPLWAFQQEDLKEEGFVDRDWDKEARVHVTDQRLHWFRK